MARVNISSYAMRQALEMHLQGFLQEFADVQAKMGRRTTQR